jgi:uncharacterized CHY-type Zn-finger protein
MAVIVVRCCPIPDLIFLTEDENGERTYCCYQCAPISGYKWIDKHDWRRAIGHKALPHLFCSVCGHELTFGEWLQDHLGGIV